jgi:hypothetical protein
LLPAKSPRTDIKFPKRDGKRRRGRRLFLMANRSVIFVGCLFALFCTSLEVERLGQAFESGRRP